MSQVIRAHFDGSAIIPDEPVNLQPGRRVRVEIQAIDDDYPLTKIASLATDMGISDLAEKHADYARGAANRDS
jgi:predicted DNA-binding antitoxin AbrB/MazE fold protein